MKQIFAVIRRDFAHVRSNAIALLVCVGLVVMPSLYAWFNIAGGWDPYGNTGQVHVALANSDEGITGGILPFRVNVGQRVVDALAGSEKIGYVVTSEDEATEGVRSGKYYAAVIIPTDFTSDLMSVLSKNPTHPQLGYYVNEKRNAIASIVTGKASGSVQSMVDTGFTEAVAQVVTELFDELSGMLDDDTLLGVASQATGVLSQTTSAIRRTASDLDGYRNVVASIRAVMSTSTAIMGDDSLSLDAAQSLSTTADGVRQLDEAANTAKDTANSAIQTGSGAVSDIESQIDSAFATAGDKAGELVDALAKVEEAATTRRDKLQQFYDAVQNLDGVVYDFRSELEVAGNLADVDIQRSHTITNDLSDVLSRTGNALTYMNDLIATVQQTMADIQTTRTNAQAGRDELVGLAASAREGIDSVRQSYEGGLSVSLSDLASTIDSAAAKASEVSSTVKNEASALQQKIDGASTDLGELETSLQEAGDKLNATADKLDGLLGRLGEATTSEDVSLVRTILGGDSAALVDFVASPVELDREAIYSVENNGSAMTPYYTTMALWVGGTLMGILFYSSLSKRAIKETGAKPRHAYFGRLAFFLAVGACQSTMLLLGDMFFLRVQCENPVLFMLTGWLASTVFINIIYSLATSFGDVGKAIAVFIMVVQVAGSGGTFPVEMLPKVFQMAYPYLPFVHSENAMRAAMFGTYGNDWAQSMAILACFLIPALVLGLVLRKPLVPVNEWIEEKMEQTELM